MMKKLDDLTVRNLKPENKTYFCMDTTDKAKKGFGVRVYPSGVKVFVFRYKVDGVQKLLNLGEYPSTFLKDAREEYSKASSKVKDLLKGKADGADPVKEIKLKAERRISEQAAQDAAPTVKTLATDYINKYAKVNKKSWLEDQRILEKEILGMKAKGQKQAGAVDWSKRKAADIKKRDVVVLLDKIVDRGSPQTACNVFKIVRKMFNWSINKDILEVSPCNGVDMPAPLVVKDRALDADEIKILWNSLDSKATSMTSEVRQAIKLILITAQRPAEVSGIHTGEIDGNWWNIPAERSKNGKAHRVYLSGLARGIIAESIEQVKAAREIPAEIEYSGFIFPCPHRAKDKPIERHALSKALKRNESPDSKTTLGVATWTPHDLRRTAATMMSELGFMDEIIDAILNHAKQGIIATYNRNKYDAEKQQALEAWERRLIGIITGTDSAKVIPIKRKAA